MATPAAIAMTMLSRSGSANAATATTAAATAAIQLLRPESVEYARPSSASTPANPSPYSSGTRSASTMPAKAGICQLSQLHVALPR